jgi:hypothetical protein
LNNRWLQHQRLDNNRTATSSTRKQKHKEQKKVLLGQCSETRQFLLLYIQLSMLAWSCTLGLGSWPYPSYISFLSSRISTKVWKLVVNFLKSLHFAPCLNKLDHCISPIVITRFPYFIIFLSRTITGLTSTLLYPSTIGKLEDTTALSLTFFLRKDTWKTGCIVVLSGSYNL